MTYFHYDLFPKKSLRSVVFDQSTIEILKFIFFLTPLLFLPSHTVYIRLFTVSTRGVEATWNKGNTGRISASKIVPSSDIQNTPRNSFSRKSVRAMPPFIDAGSISSNPPPGTAKWISRLSVSFVSYVLYSWFFFIFLLFLIDNNIQY